MELFYKLEFWYLLLNGHRNYDKSYMVLNLVYNITKMNADNSVTIHTILLKLQRYNETPPPTCFRPYRPIVQNSCTVSFNCVFLDDGPGRCNTCSSWRLIVQ